MSSTVKEVVQIKALSRYGFQAEDGRYVNWSKGTKQADKDKVVPGATFEMELFISDKGAHYVNSVGSQVGTSVAPPVAATSKPTASAVKTYLGNPGVASRDFDKEARGKTRCSLVVGLLSNAALDLSKVEEHLPMLDRLVGYVFGDK